MVFQEVGSGGMDWIYLAQDGLQAVDACECFFFLALGFHKMRGICWLAEDLLASQDGLRSLGYLISVFRSACGVIVHSADFFVLFVFILTSLRFRT